MKGDAGSECFGVGSSRGTQVNDQTESLLSVYLLTQQRLRAALGGGDASLRQAMLGDRAYLAQAEIDRPDLTRALSLAVDELLAGAAARQAPQSGHAAVLLLRQLAAPADRIHKPFHGNWYVPAYTLHEAGHGPLGQFLIQILMGHSATDGARAGQILGAGSPGTRICVAGPLDAVRLRPLLAAIPALTQAFHRYRFGSGLAEDAQLEALIRAADAGMSDESGAPADGPEFAARLQQTLCLRRHFFTPFASLAGIHDLMDAAFARAISQNELAVFVFHEGGPRR